MATQKEGHSTSLRDEDKRAREGASRQRGQQGKQQAPNHLALRRDRNGNTIQWSGGLGVGLWLCSCSLFFFFFNF